MKQFKLTFATVLLLFCLSLNTAFASHVAGVEIRFKSVSTRVYEVTLKLYRDCSGIQLCGSCQSGTAPTGCTQNVQVFGSAPPSGLPHNLPSQTCNNFNYGSYTLPIATGISVFDAVQLCNISKSVCTNCNSRTPGTFTPGMEVYTFRGNVDLTGLPASCCWVSIGIANPCCRNNAVTTLQSPGSLALFGDAQLNICLTSPNESPVFMNEADPVVISGRLFSYSIGAYDLDGDSISYRLGSTQVSRGVTAPYSSPYSDSVPFPYLGIPGQSPPLLPPLGINLNKITGLIQFTPTGQFVSYLPIEVLEWRKINNVNTLISVTKRDIQLYSSLLNNTNPPSIKVYYKGVATTASTFNLCNETQACFDIISNSSGWSSNDTTDLEVTFGSSNATATITRPYNVATRQINGPKHDTLRICINGMNNNTNFPVKPYIIYVKAKNRLCSKNVYLVRSLLINKGSNAPQINIAKETKVYGLPVKAFLTFLSNPNIVKDSTQWFIETSPTSNTFNLIGSGSDTVNNIILNQGGWFGIKASVYSSNCGRYELIDSILAKHVGVQLLNVSPEKCVGDSNGRIVFRRLGGNGTILASLQDTAKNAPLLKPWAVKDTFTNIPRGYYYLKVADSLNFRDSVIVFVNRSSTPFVAGAATLTNINCNGDSTGRAILNFTGGDSLGIRYYSFDSTNWQLSNTFNNLKAGIYRFLVKDSSNCRGSQNAVLTQPTLLVANAIVVQQIRCKGDSNAAISIQISGGSSPYQTKIGDGSFATKVLYADLKSGTYNFQVRDSKGCIKQINANIIEPEFKFSGTASITQPQCNLLPGSVRITATGGNLPYQYWLSGNTPGLNPVITNIPAGNRIIFARDSNQCLLTFNVTLNNPPALSLLNNKTETKCFGDSNGSITLIPSGGRKPYLFNLNGGNFQADSVFKKLSSGNYTLTMQDSSGCTKSLFTSLTARTPIVTTFTTSPETCLGAKNGSAIATISGGVTPYTTSWDVNPPVSGLAVSGLGGGYVRFNVLDNVQCLHVDSPFIKTNQPFADEVICGASYIQNSVQTEIAWNKTSGKNISAYKVFYQTSLAGTPIELVTLPFASNSIIIDSISPRNQLIYYSISAVDSCNNASPKSNLVAAPFLEATANGNLINLNWSYQYGANGTTGFKIYKSINNGAFIPLASVSPITTAFVDSFGTASNCTYYLEADYGPLCFSNFKIFSNKVQLLPNGISESSASVSNFRIFPNPASTAFTIVSKNNVPFSEVKLYNSTGALVRVFGLNQAQVQAEFKLPILAKGVYYIKVNNENGDFATLPLLIEP
jgi:hypothetical protein